MEIMDTLVNLENVNYVEKKEEEDLFVVYLAFQDGAYCANRFETKEEQENLYNKIMDVVS